MGRYHRARSLLSVVAATAALLLTGIGAASAQTTPTTRPRPTVPTTDPEASTFPVLQSADLPSGYRMSGSSPFRASPQSPRYPTLEKCLWNFDNPFSGLTPDIYQSSFQQDMPVSGTSIAIVFDAAKPATAFYDKFATAYTAAQKCSTTKAPSSSGTSPSNYGKVTPLKLPKLGDASLGVLITPPSDVFPPIRQAFVREGDTFVSVRITDPDLSVAEFSALTEQAVERAS